MALDDHSRLRDGGLDDVGDADEGRDGRDGGPPLEGERGRADDERCREDFGLGERGEGLGDGVLGVEGDDGLFVRSFVLLVGFLSEDVV